MSLRALSLGFAWLLAFLVLSGQAHGTSSSLQRLEALLRRNGHVSKGRLHRGGATHALAGNPNRINAALAQIGELLEATGDVDSELMLEAAAQELDDLLVEGFSRGSSLCRPSADVLSIDEVAAFKETLDLGKKVLEARRSSAALSSRTAAALIQQATAQLELLESAVANDYRFDEDECNQISQEHVGLLISALDASNEVELGSAARFVAARTARRSSALNDDDDASPPAVPLIGSAVLAALAPAAKRQLLKAYCSYPRTLRVPVPTTHYPGKLGLHTGVPTVDRARHNCSEKVQCAYRHLRFNNVALRKSTMLGVAYDNSTGVFYGTASGYLPRTAATNALAIAFRNCGVTALSFQTTVNQTARVEPVVDLVNGTWDKTYFSWEEQQGKDKLYHLAVQKDSAGEEVERGYPAGVCAGTKLAMHINWPNATSVPLMNDPMHKDRMTCLAEAWYTTPNQWITVPVLDEEGMERHYCPGDLVPSCLTCQYVINLLV